MRCPLCEERVREQPRATRPSYLPQFPRFLYPECSDLCLIPRVNILQEYMFARKISTSNEDTTRAQGRVAPGSLGLAREG